MIEIPHGWSQPKLRKHRNPMILSPGWQNRKDGRFWDTSHDTARHCGLFSPTGTAPLSASKCHQPVGRSSSNSPVGCVDARQQCTEFQRFIAEESAPPGSIGKHRICRSFWSFASHLCVLFERELLAFIPDIERLMCLCAQICDCTNTCMRSLL